MSLGIPLHTHAQVQGVDRVEILKVLTPHEARETHLRPEDILVWGEDGDLERGGERPIRIGHFRDKSVVAPGDVIRLRPGASLVSVLYRRGAFSNTLFTTDRCNSLCLMCSQPPRDEDDSWRVDELIRQVSLVDPDEAQLGVTGGEPTLLGEGLERILAACATYLPQTHVPVLSNGRNFADPALAERLHMAHPHGVTWAVPLYSDVAELHDEVVGADGAFEETLQGLFELGRLGARVELRVVLHAMTVPRLPQLAAFIYRRLPFVRHVALMGLEPMGLAKVNRERLWIDPLDYGDTLGSAIFHLHHRGFPVSIYNLPLCVLPRSLWPFARQSISGWKNVFPADCAGCLAKDHCAGFFASAGPAWRSRGLRPLLIEDFNQ